MGVSQRYQAAVDGHKMPLLSLDFSEKAEATGVRSRNTDLKAAQAGLLGVVLRLFYAVNGKYQSPMGTIFYVSGR